jgi:hypothetical protein
MQRIIKKNMAVSPPAKGTVIAHAAAILSSNVRLTNSIPS